jgi:hypothetical protein
MSSNLVEGSRIERRDGGSRPIEESPKTNSRPTSERYSFENASAENPATKRSKPSSKLRYDATNNRLPKSEVGIHLSLSDFKLDPMMVKRIISLGAPSSVEQSVADRFLGKGTLALATAGSNGCETKATLITSWIPPELSLPSFLR